MTVRFRDPPPTQLTLPQTATTEEKLLSDSLYWAQFSTGQDLYCLLQGFKALFSAKAWSQNTE